MIPLRAAGLGVALAVLLCTPGLVRAQNSSGETERAVPAQGDTSQSGTEAGTPAPLLEENRLYLEGDYQSDAVVRNEEIVWWELSGEIIIRYRSNRVETQFARYERENYRLSFPRGLQLHNRWGRLSAESGELFVKERDRFVLKNITEGLLQPEDTSEPISFTTDRISGSLTAESATQVELSGNVELRTGYQRLLTERVMINPEDRRLEVPEGTPLRAFWTLQETGDNEQRFFRENTAELTGDGLVARWDESGGFSFELRGASFSQEPLSGEIPLLTGEGSQEQGLTTLHSTGPQQVALTLSEWPTPSDRARMNSDEMHIDLSGGRISLSGGVVISSSTVDMNTERVEIERKSGGNYRIVAPERSKITIDDEALQQRYSETQSQAQP